MQCTAVELYNYKPSKEHLCIFNIVISYQVFLPIIAFVLWKLINNDQIWGSDNIKFYTSN